MFQEDRRSSRFPARYRVLLKRLKIRVLDYCRRSSLHGLANFPGANLFQGIVWFFIFFTSLSFCIYLMQMQYKRFVSVGTVTTIRSTMWPVTSVPFPAFAICNNNIVYKSRAESIIKELSSKGLDAEMLMNFFKSLPFLIHPSESKTPPLESDFKEVYENLKLIGYDQRRLMFEVAQPCEKMLNVCHWQGTEIDCANIFTRTTTLYGVCCSFNSNHLPNSTSEGGLFVAGSGLLFGLNVLFDVEKGEYFASTRPYYGARLLLYDANDFPQVSIFTSPIQSNEDVGLLIDPITVESDDGLKNMHLSKRTCFFKNEGIKVFNRSYSYQNCVAECQMQAIFKLCGCIPFYYPQAIHGRQCTLLDVPCLKANEKFYASTVYANHLMESKPYKNIQQLFSNLGLQCCCLQPCSDVYYSAVVQNYDHDLRLFSSENQSFVSVNFLKAGSMFYRRSAATSWDSLLASVGGLFGLCVGGSVLSFFEIAFYIINVTADLTRRKSFQPVRVVISQGKSREEVKPPFGIKFLN